MTNKNGIITIHNDEAPTCVIVKGYEAVALLDSHDDTHYSTCIDALVALLNVDDTCHTLENATGWRTSTRRGYVMSLADDRGHDYYEIVKFTAPTLTDTIETLQAEYNAWLKANVPTDILEGNGGGFDAFELMAYIGYEDEKWNLTDGQYDYLRAFCRRWDVVENYVSDEEIEEDEESGLDVAEAREGCIHTDEDIQHFMDHR